MTYLDAEAGQAFTVRHSKAAALRQGLRFAGAAWRFWRGYAAIRDDWRRGYAELASPGFWTARLGLTEESEPRAAE